MSAAERGVGSTPPGRLRHHSASPEGNPAAGIAQADPAVTSPPYDAGNILRAADALRSGQQTFTAHQVAYLIALTYDLGRRHAAAEDLAAMAGCWAEYAEPAPTRADRIAAELAEMDDLARRRAEREGRPYQPHPGGPVDWETGLPTHADVA